MKSNASPLVIELEPGKLYSWCSCGLSKKDPWCDGTHKEAATDKKSVKFSVPEATNAFLCMCKKTKTPPYCDGSHSI